MALDWGMDKKWLLMFASIAICFMVFEAGAIVGITTSSLNGEYEFGLYYGKLDIYMFNSDYGPPTSDGGIYYYELPLGGSYAGKDLNVDVSGVHCLLVGAFAYTRNPNAGLGEVNAVNDTLVRFDDTTFITHVPESTTTGYPWVIMVVVTPMGYSGVIPMSSVFADISVV